jgi:hypothetical protein
LHSFNSITAINSRLLPINCPQPTQSISFNHFYHAYVCAYLDLSQNKSFSTETLRDYKVLAHPIPLNYDSKWNGDPLNHLNLHWNHDADAHYQHLRLEQNLQLQAIKPTQTFLSDQRCP